MGCKCKSIKRDPIVAELVYSSGRTLLHTRGFSECSGPSTDFKFLHNGGKLADMPQLNSVLLDYSSFSVMACILGCQR